MTMHHAGDKPAGRSSTIQQLASKTDCGSNEAAKGESRAQVSVATALREITAQWQANQGPQRAVVSKSPLVVRRLNGEQIARWQTQVTAPILQRSATCSSALCILQSLGKVGCADTPSLICRRWSADIVRCCTPARQMKTA